MLEEWDYNRSVMPFDVPGSTCATLMETAWFLCKEVCCLSVPSKRGMPSKRESTVRVEYVTVFCTHRPSLFPIHTLDIMLTTLLHS